MPQDVDARPIVDGEVLDHSVQHGDDESSKEKRPEQGSPSTSGVSDTPQKAEHDNENDGGQDKKDDGPAGGFDSTPIPFRPPGYTIKITIHRAANLPMADVNSLSSDPYVIAELKTDLPTRHKEDPRLRLRTPTIRRSTDPEWNVDWIVANVPSSGFKLKLRLYDEDPADKDDRLGNVHIQIHSLSESWEGIKEHRYDVEKRSGSKRAYAIRAFATCFRLAEHMHGNLHVSIKMIGRTPEDGQNGRMYTIGPQWWTRHYSPLLGRLANVQDPGNDELQKSHEKSKQSEQDQKAGKEPAQAKRYDFQANQIQLRGPTPAPLYHRFVEFKGWIKGMFTGSGVQGFLLSKALHHQHSRVYNFDRSTQWGHFDNDPGDKVTRQFLDLVHWDQGGRMFTYILSLDALWRFTETGKEFGIDLLSKHTMHSDVSIYIAYSGEFFIRRLKHKDRPPPPEPSESTSQVHPLPQAESPSHTLEDVEGGPRKQEGPRDPANYELVIDNDSGTYRPNADLLPMLRDYLAANLPGLHIQVLDCNGDKEKMDKLKKAQRERKKKEGEHVVYKQGSRGSSISSSDESDLDELQAGMEEGTPQGHEHGALGQYARDRKLMNSSKWNKVKRDYGGRGRRNDGEDTEPSGSGAEASRDATK